MSQAETKATVELKTNVKFKLGRRPRLCIAKPELIARVESEQAGGGKDFVDAKVRLPVNLR